MRWVPILATPGPVFEAPDRRVAEHLAARRYGGDLVRVSAEVRSAAVSQEERAAAEQRRQQEDDGA